MHELVADDGRVVASAVVGEHDRINAVLTDTYRRDLAAAEADMLLQAAFLDDLRASGVEVSVRVETRKTYVGTSFSEAQTDWLRRDGSHAPALPDRDGRAVWTDPVSGATVWAVPGKRSTGPKRLVCVAADRHVLWSIARAEKSEVKRIHLPQADGIPTMAEFLARGGYRLADGLAPQVAAVGGTLVNGIPVRMSFPKLREIKAEDGSVLLQRIARPEWSTAAPGEDRFWRAEPASGMSWYPGLTLLVAAGTDPDGTTVARIVRVQDGVPTDEAARRPGASMISILADTVAAAGMRLDPLQAATLGLEGRPASFIDEATGVRLAPHPNCIGWTVKKGGVPAGVVMLGARLTVRLDDPTDLPLLGAVAALLERTRAAVPATDAPGPRGP